MSAQVAEAIPFNDLFAQRRRLGGGVERAIARVLDHGQFILGPEVEELEHQLAEFCGAAHCVTCANGTDALALVLAAELVGPGDAVFVPAFTFVAPAEMVPGRGATPVFVDVLPDSFNIDPVSLEAAIGWAKRQGLRPRVVIAVDLFGQPADYPRLARIAKEAGAILVADAAQSFGAALDGAAVGTLADWTTTSFFPAKPLGCYGDGGAIFTADSERAALVRSLRFHGKGADKYAAARVGVNSRLDTIQAAILIEKLAIFADEIAARDRVAKRYAAGLGNAVATPMLDKNAASVWAQYTIQAPNRDVIALACKAAGIPTAIYYPSPVPGQEAYRDFPVAPDGVPVAERLSRSVISLPMHAYLEPAVQDRIVAAVRAAASKER